MPSSRSPGRRRRTCLAVASALLLGVVRMAAAAPPGDARTGRAARADTTPPAAPATPAPTPAPGGTPAVRGPRLVALSFPAPGDAVTMGDAIRVRVDGLLDTLRRRAIDPATLVLYLDGRPLPGVTAAPVNDDELEFHLARSTASMTTWRLLLGAPPPFTRALRVGIGPPGGPPLAIRDSTDRALRLELGPSRVRLALSIVALGLAVLGFRAGMRRGMLRDPVPEGMPPVDPSKRPWSLARCFAALWLGVVLVSFLFIYALTGDANVLTPQAVTLLGISGGTLIGAAGIDAGKKPTAPASDALPSIGVDLFGTEGGGLAFHRFQLGVWTVVLVGLFLATVWRELAMPTFDGSLLATLGISAGTYLGLKVPERLPATPTPATPAPVAAPVAAPAPIPPPG